MHSLRLCHRLDDGSLPLAFIHHAMALCLADSVNMPATFYVMHTDLSSHSVLKGWVENYAAECFRRWIKDKAYSPTPGSWYVLDLGFFDEASEALVAKVKVAGVAELALLIRYLREEVLAARAYPAEDMEALSPCAPAAAAAAASSASSLASQIHGLRGVLETLCKAYEARAAELAATKAEATGTGVASTAAVDEAARVLRRHRDSRRTRRKGAAARCDGGSRSNEDEFSLVSAVMS